MEKINSLDQTMKKLNFQYSGKKQAATQANAHILNVEPTGTVSQMTSLNNVRDPGLGNLSKLPSELRLEVYSRLTETSYKAISVACTDLLWQSVTTSTAILRTSSKLHDEVSNFLEHEFRLHPPTLITRIPMRRVYEEVTNVVEMLRMAKSLDARWRRSLVKPLTILGTKSSNAEAPVKLFVRGAERRSEVAYADYEGTKLAYKYTIKDVKELTAIVQQHILRFRHTEKLRVRILLPRALRLPPPDDWYSDEMQLLQTLVKGAYQKVNFDDYLPTIATGPKIDRTNLDELKKAMNDFGNVEWDELRDGEMELFDPREGNT